MKPFSCVPPTFDVSSFLSDALKASAKVSSKSNKKVLVIGSGCAGLGAAWHLNRAGIDVTVFEKACRLGGHANTIIADGVAVDTGFMVYNELNYPHLCSFFEEVGVKGTPTTMGFSVSMNNGSFEWCSDSLSGLLATPTNVVNPQFYIMMRDIMKFNKEAISLLKLPEAHPDRGVTVRDFLATHSLSEAFRDFYLVPMTAAIWSATANDMLNFPALTLFTFLNNHLLLQVSEHINWQTPSKRSQEYVQIIASELKDRAQVDMHISSIKRKLGKRGGTEVAVTARQGDGDDRLYVFDEVIFACHPDQALSLLGSDATEDEMKYLSTFRYADNDTYVHCDEDLMPKSKAAWTSWNYIGTTDGDSEHKPVFVTYWLNRLQSLSHSKPIFVSLNPSCPPDPSKTFSRIQYAHPQYSLNAVASQRDVASIQGANSTYFCGAWMGYGFHEDGFRSGLEVAMVVSKTPVPWIHKIFEHYNVHFSNKKNDVKGSNSLLNSMLIKPAAWMLERMCQQQVIAFLRQGFVKGKLTLTFPNNEKVELTGSLPGHQVGVKVNSNMFFVRIALEADIGMARSFIAGDWEVVESLQQSESSVASSKAYTVNNRYDNLTAMLSLLIDNMPHGSAGDQGGWDAKKLLTACIGSTINKLYYHFAMDNSIANSQSNIHAHYDLSNKLFETFLDKEYMMYSSAVFNTILTPNNLIIDPQDTLEEAQVRKMDMLLSRLEPISTNDTLLDIGFGWGGLCIRAAQKYGCKVRGITLSVEQLKYAQDKVKSLGLDHLITFEMADYRQFAANCAHDEIKFDRIVSCEMIEAVGHNYLGSFFAAVESLLHPQGIFIMQAINMPDSRYQTYIQSTDFINTIIFPGGCCPSLSALLEAMTKHSTMFMDTCTNWNLHYAETLRRWRYNFNNTHATNPYLYPSLGFDEHFMRLWNLYLCYCEAGFEKQVLNLQVLTFTRPANENMRVHRHNNKKQKLV